MIGKVKLAVAIAAMSIGTAANATIATVYDGVTAGVASFDATVTGAGSTVAVDIWSGMSDGTSIDRGDYEITQNDGGSGDVSNYGSLSGQVISINPAGGTSNPRSAPSTYFNSGITFTFDTAVNAVGFEMGDWATCCHNPVTELFISFDGGTPILVGSATEQADGQFPSQTTGNNVYEIFVAAFDDTGDFTEVSFWGNGIGELLYAGGQVRYALLDQGSLPPSGVPAPAPLALMAFGLLGVAWRNRKAS